MASRRGGKYLRKSAIPGVTITQYVDDIPKGCSTPDFERKPITLTLSEGKNAIFRAVVKGEPKPQVLWKRNSKEMDDPQKYQTSFIPGTNEFILQINKITSEDADLYRCTAVNEYGEATCTTGLKIIQVGFKKKTKEAPSVPQADLKKEIQDFRKILKKRAPTTAPKKEINMEQVWQLLLNADRKDYEKICLKYGIVDFRGMLRKLQEMKKEREDKQALYVSNLINLRHVKVNQEQRNASFDVEMDLKNPESRIYLYKDGQMINFGFNSDNVKHCLRQVGKKYNFIISDLQLEDAGVYQVKVEDVDIFSTELEAESIPVSFRHPLGELRCQEQGNAVFQCTLYDPCFSPMWFHKNCRLETNDKYDISVTKDGLTHRLVIKNTQPSDKGTYTIDIGSHSSSAWLEVEPSKGKRKKAEGDNDDKAGQQKKLLEEDHAKKFRQGVESENQEHFGMGKDGQHRNGQDGSEGIHDSFGKGKDGKMKRFSGAGVDMAEGDQFTTLGGNGVCGETGTAMGSLYNKHALLGDMGSRDAGGLLTLEGQDSALSGAGPGDRFGRARGMGTQDSTSGSSSIDRNQHGMGAISGAGIGFGMPGVVEGFYGNQVTLGGPGDRCDGGLYSKDSGQGDASGAGTGGIGALYGRDDKLAGIGLSSARGRDGLYGEDGKTGAVGITGDGAEIEMRLHNRDGTIAGRLGTDGSNAGRRVDGTGAGVGAGASGIGGLYSKDGMTGGIGTGGPGDAEGISGLYGKDGLSGGAGAGSPHGAGGIVGLYGKDGMPGSMSVWTDKSGVPAGIDGFHGKNRMTGGTGTCGPGGTEGVGSIYDRNGMLGGAGGPGDAAGISGRYSKGTIPGISAGGPGDAMGIGGVHGKDGILSGAGTVGPGSENGVLTGSGGPAGGAGRTGGLYSKDGMPGGVGLSGAGGAEIGGRHYRKEDMLGGAGAGRPGGASGIGKPYGKDMAGAGTDVPGGRGGIGGLYAKDGMPSRAGSAQSHSAAGAGGVYGKGSTLSGAGAAGEEVGLCGMDDIGERGGAGGVSGFFGTRDILGGAGGVAGLDGDNSGVYAGAGVDADLYGKNRMAGRTGTHGAGGPGDTGRLYGKNGMLDGAGSGRPGGVGIEGGQRGKDGMPIGAGTGGPGGAGGIGGLYGKDGMPIGAGTGGPGGAGGIGGLYGKDSMPIGAGTGGPGGAGGIGGLYGKDGLPIGAGTGPGGAGGIGGLYGKDGLPIGAGTGAPGGAGGIGGLYGKDGMPIGAGTGGAGGAGGIGGLYGKDSMPIGAGTGGPGGAGGIGGLYGKDGLPIGAGTGPGGAGGIGGLYGKDGLPIGAGTGGPGGAGGIGGLYGKDGLPIGAGTGPGGAGGIGGLYGKDGLPIGAGTSGPGGAGGIGGLYGKDGLPIGAGTGGPGGAGGIGGLYGKDGMPIGAGTGGPGGAGGIGGLYGKDGMPIGAGTGPGGAGGIGGLYGKDGLPIGAGTGGPGGAGGIGGLYGKDGLPIGAGTSGPGGAGGIGGLYGKDGLPIGAGTGGPGGAGGIGGLYGKDGLPIGAGTGGPGGAGGIGGLYGKDGMPIGAGTGGPGGAGGIGGPYGKDGMPIGAGTGGPGGAGGIGGLYGKDGMPIGAGTGGPGGAVGIGGPYGKDGMPFGAGTGGPGGAGGIGGLYGRDGMPIGAGTGGPGGAGGIGGPYGKDGMPIGVGPGGAGGIGGLYGKDGLPIGAGTGGPGGAGGIGGLYGKDGMPIGAGTGGPGGAGGIGGPYGKDGMPIGVGPGGAGGIGGLYGKDGMPIGAGTGGPGGAGGIGGPYGKDGMPIGAGTGGPGGAGGIGGLYGKDGMPIGAGTGGPGGAGGIGGLYGKDGLPIGAGTGGPGGAGGIGGLYGKDGLPIGAGTGGPGGAGGIGGLYGKDGLPIGAGTGGPGGAGGIGGLYGKDGLPIGAGTGGPGGAGGIGGLYGKEAIQGGLGSSDAGGVGGIHGKDGMPGGSRFRGPDGGGAGGLYDKDGVLGGTADGRPVGAGGIDGLYGKDGMTVGAGNSGHGAVGNMDAMYGIDGTLGRLGTGVPVGASDTGLFYGKDGKLGGTGARSTVPGNEGGLGSVYDRDGGIDGVDFARGIRGIDGSLHEKMSGLPGEEFQSSGLYGAGSLAGDRRRQLPDLDGSGLASTDMSRHRDRKGKERSLLEEDMSEQRCHFREGLFDVCAQKGTSAVLSCILNNDQFEGTWFKDGFKITGQDQVSIEKDGPVHKLIIHNVQDSHAGKYKFEAEGVRTEASVFVEDPPNVDSALLEKLRKEPIVVKAGKNAMVKIPFEGKKPIRTIWLKDEGELLDDTRISTDYSDSYTRLSISSTNRKDCGDYKLKLKNESGSLEAAFKLVVIDKPQPPAGPIAVVDSSTSGITIQWKPPRDDGGKPVQRYIVERQQVGRKTWLTLGETSGDCTIFTTNKVEHDKSYYFRVKAVNAEGTSEALESDEVMAATKVFPGPPAPPKIVSANKGAITLSWAAPHKTGNSRILGYTIEKCKRGSNSWTPVTDLPITDRKYVVTDLKEGLQYEFRVAAINAAGVGEPSAPSEAAFARDPMKPPGPVRDLKVVSTDYCSISLSWMKPEAEDESCAKGYIVEIRHSDVLKWTQCNALPIPATTYAVRGLKSREMYFLRVRAVNDGGLGDPVELDTCIQTIPPIVQPKLLVKDTVKSFMIVKSGNTIRVRIPFEASPTPDVVWLKDGLALPAKATVATREGISQLIIPKADFSDSGHYTIILRTEHGSKVTFSFLVQVLDAPESPGPIQLVEKVPDTVTLIWEPSPTEKKEGILNYMVMMRDSTKGSWQLVADLIYTNKCTVANFMPGREYFFRVLAKNCMGISEPSETVQPWSIRKEKAKFELRLPRYKGINQTQPPRFLVPLKPHVVTLGFDCHMSCAVTGHPAPQVTWYKDGKNISQDHSFFSKNDFGVCSLVIPGVTPSDGGQYKVVAINELGQASSKAELTIKEPSF